uniref:Protein sidekick-1-like n=1 Tax=Crassostrea virginica TaxID=6565 RepID=A0A8B8CRR3_CRAVI|nr:protein sidekick-1-like [Crassostrea virginica]
MIVNGLRPARYFQVMISAVNSVGEGSSSDPKPMPPIRMPEQAPSSPPKGFYGTHRSNSSIMLLWQAPSEDTWNGDLRGYRIRYKLTNYPDSTYQSVDTINPLVTTYELTNLIIFQSYEFQIAAYNNEGVGVFSNTIEERTMEGQPTRAPRNAK